jgi:hypothetical protein
MAGIIAASGQQIRNNSFWTGFRPGVRHKGIESGECARGLPRKGGISKPIYRFHFSRAFQRDWNVKLKNKKDPPDRRGVPSGGLVWNGPKGHMVSPYQTKLKTGNNHFNQKSMVTSSK